MSDDGILHFNPWMDFNDGSPTENPFSCDSDAEQVAIFLDAVFSWCAGLIPLRGFVDKGPPARYPPSRKQPSDWVFA